MELFEDLMYLFSSMPENRNIIRLNLREAALLYKIAQKTDGDIVEIGRKYGGSALLLASASKAEQTVFSIDTKTNKKVKISFGLAPDYVVRKIKLIKGDSKAIGKKWNSSVGLVFIDGDHSFEGVKSDIKYWLPKINIGGYAAFHDVVGTVLGLEVLIDDLKTKGWLEVGSADTMVVLQREK